MTAKADKLPLETEPVARDNNTILTLKFVAPYSTDNRSKSRANSKSWRRQILMHS